MKRNILLLVVSIMSLPNIVAQDWAYSNTLMGNENVTVINSTNDSNGFTSIIGHFDSNLITSSGEEIQTFGGKDFFTVKFDPEGNVSWVRNFGGRNQEDVFGGIGTDLDGNIYITGGFQDELLYSSSDSILGTGRFDSFLAKISNDGDVLYCINIGSGAHIQRTTALDIDTNGDIIVAGFFKDSITILNDTTIYAPNTAANQFYAKFNPVDGSLIWAKSINPISGTIGIRTYDILATSDSYYFTGVYNDSIGFENDTISSPTSFQNTYLFKTDLFGQQEWVRSITGENDVLGYSITADLDQSIYLVGHHNNLTVIVDSSDFVQSSIVTNTVNKGHDFLILKYSVDGYFQWLRSVGGLEDDKLTSSTFFDGTLSVSGYFTDSIQWGGLELKTNGPADRDMFIGELDIDGNYRSANSFGGKNNSVEDARSVFSGPDNVFAVIRSNSEILILGDSIYLSNTGKYYIALGVIGCRPISIDQVIAQNVQTCFGDSTGAIQILASGGFGAPWQYSIDNGLNYEDIAYFANLPAGDYPIVVIDAENCAQSGPTEIVSQPDQLSIELISDQLVGNMIEIVVTAAGGSAPYTYTLQPDGIVQGFGTFNVEWNDTSSYFVEVNDLNGCGPVATDTLNTFSGIEITAPGVKLYPNPTSGVITLEMPFDGAEATLEVLSLTGQVLVSRQVYSAGGVINETVDLSNLSKGMYMIRVEGQTLRSGVVVN